MKRWMFYALSLTWGLPMVLVGFLTAIFLLATGHRPYRRSGCWYFEIGNSKWGGLSLGLTILCQPNAPDSLKNHELGHAIQNCRFGPIMPVLVLCSSIRYHYLNYLEKEGLPVMPYDSWWFEGEATRLGEQTYNRWITNN